MNKHINQCIHNEDFLSKISSLCPENFFDWKITIVFYCGTHLIRGYATHKKNTITGERHTNVFEFIEKEIGNDSKVYKSFKTLYRNSRDSRYSGFTTRENFERFSEIKLNESKIQYGHLKSYIESQGLKVEEIQKVA